MARLPALAAALVLAALPAAAQPAVSTVEVEGTEFVVRLADGRALRSKDVVGAVLDVQLGESVARLRIAAIEPDPQDSHGTVWLHTLEHRRPDGAWVNLCTPGPDGRTQGFPLARRGGGFDLACSSGAVAKCVRAGYRPWADAADGTPHGPRHAACVRLLRGDYGGDNRSWARDGTMIDIYDPLRIQRPANEAGDAFEAGWGPDGAVCVHHPRVKENVTLAQLEERYPHLKGRTGAVCTEAFALAHGALVLNRSEP